MASKRKKTTLGTIKGKTIPKGSMAFVEQTSAGLVVKSVKRKGATKKKATKKKAPKRRAKKSGKRRAKRGARRGKRRGKR